MIGVTPSPTIAEKAIRLINQHRVHTWPTITIARVNGDTTNYVVEATHAGVRCTCQAGANLDPASCSHKVAAMITWAEA